MNSKFFRGVARGQSRRRHQRLAIDPLLAIHDEQNIDAMARASNRFWWVPFGSVPEIAAQELHTRIAEGRAPYLLDVRTNREWTDSRIAGAVNLPIINFRSGLATLELERAQPIVAICLTAHRSIPAVRALRAAGFEHVQQLQGGMRAWWKAGLPVVEGAQP